MPSITVWPNHKYNNLNLIRVILKKNKYEHFIFRGVVYLDLVVHRTFFFFKVNTIIICLKDINMQN